MVEIWGGGNGWDGLVMNEMFEASLALLNIWESFLRKA